MKTILILGGSVMQLPALKNAKAQGWTVLCADGNDQVIGKELCDHFFHIDLKDRVALAETAFEWKEKKGLDGVFTAGTDFSSSVAWVAQELGLPGIPYQTSLNATDKSRMRSCFSEAKVPSPRFSEVDADSSLKKAADYIGFPLVIKPVDSMGARGVVRVDSLEQMKEAVVEAVRHSRTGRALAEEFLEGPEFSIDSLVFEGDIHISGIADRHIYFPPCFIETGHTIPSAYSAEEIEKIISVFKQGVQALGIDLGAAKGDIKLTPRGPVIGEIAARLSGGYMSGWTYPYSSGVNLTLAAMKLAVGDAPGDLNPERNEYCAERAVYSIDGIVEEIRHIDEIYNSSPLIKELFLLVEEGDEVRFPRNNVEKSANWLAADPDRELCIELAEKAAAGTFIRLQPGNSDTWAFLNEEIDFPPSAFHPDLQEKPDWYNRIAADSPSEALTSLGRYKADRYEIIPFFLNQGHCDWFGRSLDEAGSWIQEELAHRGINLQWDQGKVPDIFDFYFWKSVLRGSVQGGVWFLETING